MNDGAMVEWGAGRICDHAAERAVRFESACQRRGWEVVTAHPGWTVLPPVRDEPARVWPCQVEALVAVPGVGRRWVVDDQPLLVGL